MKNKELDETRIVFINNGKVEINTILWDDVSSLKQKNEQNREDRKEKLERK